ncbi:MAG: nucleoside hydrolase [Oscillospiraceae bacterium]|nr:nucleoside hydrolase [Oscillospiraceae bacterium]
MTNRIPVIIDTDMGVDDAYSVMLALSSSKMNVLGITTSYGNVTAEAATLNAIKILELLEKRVRVAKGASGPLFGKTRKYSNSRGAFIHGRDGLGNKGYSLSEPVHIEVESDAVDYMAELIKKAESKVTIVALGPLTNIATLIIAYPELRSRIDGIAMMGGSAYGGNTLPAGESNIVADPEAAQIVLQSGLRIVMCGLEATEKAYFIKDDLEMFRLIGGSVGRFYYDMTQDYMSALEKLSGERRAVIHDSVPVAWLLNPSVLKARACHVEVDLSGQYTRACTVTDEACTDTRPNAMVAFDLDRDLFVRMHIEAFKQYR